VSIGAVIVQPGRFRRAEEVASEAAVAKHHAKSSGRGLKVLGDSPWARFAKY
jgi:hypothetical protein